MFWSSLDVSTLKDEIRIMRWAGYVARMGDRRDAYGVFIGRPDGKRKDLGRPRPRRGDNIKKDMREVR